MKMNEKQVVPKTPSEVAEQESDTKDLSTVKIKVLQGHTDSINSCQLIQNSRAVFSASADGSVRFWDFTSGNCLYHYDKLHTVNISQAHATPSGTRFLSCGWDKKLKYSDGETGQSMLEKSHDDFLTCCRISHNEKLIAVGSDFNKALTIYDLESGLPIHHIKGYHESSLTSIKFAPSDDKIITTSKDKTAKFFDLVSAKTTITLEGHSNIISSCSITKDERNFATASWDKTVLLWDVATGSYRSKGPLVLNDGHDGSINCCEFSNDGLLLVSGSCDMNVVVWDVESNVQKLKLQGHTGWVNDACFSEDQQWVLSCSKDKTLRLWNITNYDPIPIALENKKTTVKIIKCSKCAKPFSMSQLENFRDVTMCVFCRLANPEKSWLHFTDPKEPILY